MNIIKGQHWAVIPSRANSQRFPGKALACLCGSVLVERAIETAFMAQGIKTIIINTNDESVKWYVVGLQKIRHGRMVIHERQEEVARPNTRIDDTLIDMVKNMDEVPEFLHLIQLTSPFIHYSHVQEGNAVLNTNDIDSVQLVAPVSNTQHAYSQRVINDGEIEFRYKKDRESCFNSQSKPVFYAFGGYVGFRTQSLLKTGCIWGETSLPIIGGPECLIDIDTPEDLQFAEAYLKVKQEEVRYAAA